MFVNRLSAKRFNLAFSFNLKKICDMQQLVIFEKWKYAYDALWKTEIICRRCSSWLIRTTSVSQDSQLLGAWNSAFSERTKLNPISADRLIGIYDEIVTFTYSENIKMFDTKLMESIFH